MGCRKPPKKYGGGSNTTAFSFACSVISTVPLPSTSTTSVELAVVDCVGVMFIVATVLVAEIIPSNDVVAMVVLPFCSLMSSVKEPEARPRSASVPVAVLGIERSCTSP